MIYLINHNDLSNFDSKLILYVDEKKIPIGLGSGKMGYCIYFYQLSRIHSNFSYKAIAEKILDEIFNEVKKENSFDILNGLSGIGLGINYLIEEKFICGNINYILEDIDNAIFRKLSYPQNYSQLSNQLIIDFLIYLNTRIITQKKGSEKEYLFNNLIMHTINLLYDKINSAFFEELYIYTLTYQLPPFLYALSQTYQNGIYQNKIALIVEELSFKLCSNIPASHTNRLYFIWGMHTLQTKLNIKKLEEHINLLTNTLNFDTILSEELGSKNIFFEKGLTSVYLLTDRIKEYFPDQSITNFKKKIINKILISPMWTLLKNDANFHQHLGLFEGYCGVSLLIKKAVYEN